jgi:Secretion system C-terminal sorting domain/Ig-like domain CHU_C associated
MWFFRFLYFKKHIHKPQIMKNFFLIFLSLLVFSIYSQNDFVHQAQKKHSLVSELKHKLDFSKGADIAKFQSFSIKNDGEDFYTTSDPKINVPSPILTTSAANLEICTGKSTTLTAKSNYDILWYSTPPPMGTPIGSGTLFVTPELTTGYYTYYAIASNNGNKSAASAMEVVMVYPLPTIGVVSDKNTLCNQQTAKLTAFGTTLFYWSTGEVSQNITISPNKTSTYKVTGINTAGCKNMFEYTQFVEDCTVTAETDENNKASVNTGFSDLVQHKYYTVYPNPNYGEFSISANSVSENTRVEIYSCLGELVYNSHIQGEITTVSLKNNSKGIYIVRILENNKLLKQQKVIKE